MCKIVYWLDYVYWRTACAVLQLYITMLCTQGGIISWWIELMEGYSRDMLYEFRLWALAPSTPTVPTVLCTQGGIFSGWYVLKEGYSCDMLHGHHADVCLGLFVNHLVIVVGTVQLAHVRFRPQAGHKLHVMTISHPVWEGILVDRARSWVALLQKNVNPYGVNAPTHSVSTHCQRHSRIPYMGEGRFTISPFYADLLTVSQWLILKQPHPCGWGTFQDQSLRFLHIENLTGKK